MKRHLSLLILTALFCAVLPHARAAGRVSVRFYDEASGRYQEEVSTDLVALTLDGVPLTPDGSPALVQYIEVNGRTLVPVRTVAEALGATVSWIPENRQVILLREGSTIVLTLGSATAVVDGQQVSLPGGVPAGVVMYREQESTMVPLRFVSEQLGAEVEWDGAAFTANISTVAQPLPEPDPIESPVPEPVPTPGFSAGADRGFVTGISSDSDAQTVTVRTDHLPDYRVLDLGDRVVVDVLGAVLSNGETEVVTIPVDNDLISTVRYSLHADDLGYGYPHTVRVVLDLESGITYAKNLRVEAGAGGVKVSAFPSEGERNPVHFVPSVPLDPNKSTIVIDPGHGGSRSGAVYPDALGNDIMEKDLTLSMSLKLRDILRTAGYNVVMIREDDRDVDLYERADIANAVGADLFVSVHCNASGTVPTFQGIYTYHHPESQRGALLAQAIQTPLCAVTGAIDRGINDADFVVLRETEMCAVLVETGFMSNSEELSRLCDSAYQARVAQGIAEGITQYLNSLKK